MKKMAVFFMGVLGLARVAAVAVGWQEWLTDCVGVVVAVGSAIQGCLTGDGVLEADCVRYVQGIV